MFTWDNVVKDLLHSQVLAWLRASFSTNKELSFAAKPIDCQKYGFADWRTISVCKNERKKFSTHNRMLFYKALVLNSADIFGTLHFKVNAQCIAQRGP